MLTPKKVKHRKWHKGRARNIRHATDKITLAFGSYGLKAQTHTWMSARQIESVRRVITRYLRKGGKVWIRVFPDKPITKKGSEVPMGSGKGAVEHYVVCIKPGMVMFEVDGLAPDMAREALTRAGHKLSCKTTIISR